LISPASDGCSGAKFKIVWMGDDTERCGPRFVNRLEIWHAP
jgi:hypothetical protein